jgi:tetratricopeptide (TPR) repeat protein
MNQAASSTAGGAVSDPRRRALGALLAASVFVAAGCASAPKRLVYSPDEIRERIERSGVCAASSPAADCPLLEVPYEVSPELVASVRPILRPGASQRQKLERLADLIESLRYDLDLPLTAERAYQEQAGNCISATSLFVGLARALGLPAVFVEALNVRDVSVSVDFGRVADDVLGYQMLSDLEATARFYNTLGYHALRDGEHGRARRYFETALALDEDLAWAHNNLAVTLRRAGDADAAEAAFRRAIDIDPRYAPARANLARLLARQGREREAAAMRAEAEALRRRDPLRVYRRATAAYERARYEEAAALFRRATRLEKDFLQAWLGYAESQLELGELRSARRALQRVLRADPDNDRALALREKLR